MRSKEDAHDYRYFPDPDLLPLRLDPARIAELKAALPELPDAKKARFMREYGLSLYDASTLIEERATADWYEAVVRGGRNRDPKIAANWTDRKRVESGKGGSVRVDLGGRRIYNKKKKTTNKK